MSLETGFTHMKTAVTAGLIAVAFVLFDAGLALGQGVGLPNQSRDIPLEIVAD